MADETKKQPTEGTAPSAADETGAKTEGAGPANDANGGAQAGGREPPTPLTAEQQMIQELEAERDQLKDQLLRSLAEVENVRKRAEREKTDTKKFAVANFARELLTIADNLQRALDSAPDVPDDDPLSGFLDGVAMTERELLAVFQRNSIVRIEALGERFDHNLHQAMFEVENTGQPPGTVVQELQPGYKLHDRLLRPAMVGVAKNSGGDEVPDEVDTVA